MFREQLRYYLKYDEYSTNDYLKLVDKVDLEYFSRFSEKYSLKKLYNDIEDKTVYNVVRWVYEILLYTKNIENTFSFANSIEMLQFARQHNVSLNCYCHSYILKDALTSCGIKSRIIYCLPVNCEYYGNHVVVEYYSKHYQKWAVVDPTYNFYFISNNGEPLSLLELRQAIAIQDYGVVIDNDRFIKISKNKFSSIDYFEMMEKLIIVLQYEGLYNSDIYSYRLLPANYKVPILVNDIDKIIYEYNSCFFYNKED